MTPTKRPLEQLPEIVLPTAPTPPNLNPSRLKILAYGDPKVGKSTWCASTPNAIVAATEPGLGALSAYQVPIGDWRDMKSFARKIIAGGHPFEIVITDTLNNALTMCTSYVCQKLGIVHASDLDFGKGYEAIRDEFRMVWLALAARGYGLVFTAHTKQKEMKWDGGKYMKTVPNLTNKAHEFIGAWVDMTLYFTIEESGAEGEVNYHRVIRSRATPQYEAGDRYACLPDPMDMSWEAFASALEIYRQRQQEDK